MLPDYDTFLAEIGDDANPYLPFDLEVERDPKTRQLKRPILIDYVETGGVSGGSCWDSSNPQPYSTGKRLGAWLGHNGLDKAV